MLLAIPVALGAGNVYRGRWLPADVPAEWLGAAISLGAFALLLPLWLLSPDSASAIASGGLPYLGLQVFVGAAAEPGRAAVPAAAPATG